MQYKLKNISGKTFNFEGVIIEKAKVSGELSPEVYQRLLSLYYGHTLMPIDDPSYNITDEKPKEKEKPEKEEKEEKEELKEKEKFICEICKKEFQTKKGLLAHIRFKHTQN